MPNARTRIITIAVALGLAGTGHAVASTAGIDLRGTSWDRVASPKGLDPALLYAIALVESGQSLGRGKVSPWPYTVRGPAETVRAASKEEAVAALNKATAHSRNVDVGLMQVNLRWHGHRVGAAADLLDPLKNLTVATDILVEHLNAGVPLWEAVGRYHNPTWPARANAYAARVSAVYYRMKGL